MVRSRLSMNNNFLYLNFINFTDVSLWDFKRYVAKKFASSYPIVKLGNYIQEENTKVKPFDFPDKDFPILGVNNKTGLFDAYIEKGSNINQPYKVVKDGFLAYNPYRVNVGSIGLKTAEQKYNYISPAYVVFSCRQGLLPEFLYILFRTNKFNIQIRESTTGSVRQTLSFSSMGNIEIPLPSIEKQKEIVEKYNSKIQKIVELEFRISSLLQEKNNYMNEKLGIVSKVAKVTLNKLNFINYSDIKRWGISFALKDKENSVSYSNDYKIKKIKEVCSIGSGGTPSRTNADYYNNGTIPWVKTTEVRNDIIRNTEEHITNDAILNSSAKIYPTGSLIIAMYGQGETRGRTAKLGIDAATNQACCVLSDISAALDTDYFWFYLMNEYARLRELASGNNQPNLNAQMIASYPVIIPPYDIQKEIVETVTGINNQLSEARQNIERFKIEAQQQFEKELFE